MMGFNHNIVFHNRFSYAVQFDIQYRPIRTGLCIRPFL